MTCFNLNSLLSRLPYYALLATVSCQLIGCAGSPHKPAPVVLRGSSSPTYGGLSASSAKTVTVGVDDTVYSIAHKHHTSTRTLIQANDLHPPYRLAPGQVLKLPESGIETAAEDQPLQQTSLTAQQDVRVAPTMPSRAGGLPTPLGGPTSLTPPVSSSIKSIEDVSSPALKPLGAQNTESNSSSSEDMPLKGSKKPSKSGLEKHESLEEAAERKAFERDYGKDSSSSKKTKKIVSEDNEEPGTLAEPSFPKAKKKVENSPSEPEDKPAPKHSKTSKAKESDSTPEVDSGPTKDQDKNVAFDASATFSWPLQGKVTATFGSKIGNARSTGINILAAKGTPIKAAGAGKVIYVGNGKVPSLGNLVVIKHEGGWVTAYAHSDKIFVTKDDTVTEGQIIAKVGVSGNVAEPQLHFKVFKGKTPVDPQKHLQ